MTDTVRQAFGLDPRPDITEDTTQWTAILRLSSAYDTDVSNGAHAALYSARVIGCPTAYDAEAGRMRVHPPVTRQYWPAVLDDLKRNAEPINLILTLAGMLPACQAPSRA